MSVSKDYEKSLQKKVRKDNGIFYTQREIANYISRKSIDYWLEENSNNLTNIRILDPSCGTGIFLMACFDYLLELYQKEFPNSTTIEKEILENNLFGVDIDKEALAILQQEFYQKTNHLCKNIRHGNSLISDKTISDFGFDWQKEFLHGFDVIVGNPPYVDIRMIKTEEKDYFNIHFRQKNNFDLYTLFIERGLELMNKNGVLSFIVPRLLISNSTFSAIRSMMFENEIKEINLLKEKVFEDAEVESVIFLLKKAIPKATFKGKIGLDSFETLHLEKYKNGMSLILQPKEIIQIFERFENIQNNTFTELENIVEIARGLELGKSTLEKVQFSKNDKVGIFAGNAIGKYSFDKDFVFYVEENEIKPYLKTLSSEYTNYPRLLMRRVAKFPIATLLLEGEPFINNLNTVYNLILKEEQKANFDKLFLLAILNSTFLRFYCEKKLSSDEKLFPYLRIEQIKLFPIPIISSEKQEIIIQKVNELLEFQKELDNQNRSFIKILKADFKINKLSKKLKNWSDLEYSEFINEVDKKNILSFQEKKKWLISFEAEQKISISLSRKRYNLDQEIDELIFNLYQINKKEKQIIFDSLSQ